MNEPGSPSGNPAGPPARRGPVGAVRALLREPLMLSAYSVMASTALTALLGVGFWALAARTFTPSDVGNNGVLITAMITLSSVCQLNLGNALLRFVPRSGDGAPRVVLGSYALASAAALVGGIAFVLIAPAASDSFAFINDTSWLPFAFVAGVVLWGVFGLQDSALTALRSAQWLPFENSAFGLGKLALLVAFAAAGVSSAGLFLAWVAPLVVLIPVMNWLLFTRAMRVHLDAPHTAPVTDFDRGRLRRFLVTDYIGSVFGQATLTLVPIIVLGALGSEEAGFFYVPFSLIVAFDLLFWGVTTSLVAEAARDEARHGDLARMVVRRFLSFQIPAAVAIALAAPLLLLPFGHDYVEEGTTVLRLMALASIARAVVFLYASACRIQGRSGLVALVEAALLAVLVPGVWIMANAHGLDGVGVAWLVGNTLVGLAVAWPLWRFLRR